MTYDTHYSLCQEMFSNGSEKSAITNGLWLNPCDVGEKYYEMVHSLSEKASKAFGDSEDIKKTEYSENIIDTLKYPETEGIISLLYDQISCEIFNSHFTTNKIAIYKSTYSEAKLENTWKWHWDDNPGPHIKLFVYLTEVSDSSAPFSYMSNINGEPIKMESSKISPSHSGSPKFPNSRLPGSFIDEKVEGGCSVETICGKAGTHFIFDPNIIHRGTVPHAGQSRIALAYHMHPVTEKTNEFYNIKNRDVKKYDLL